jgi:hypothetical protein
MKVQRTWLFNNWISLIQGGMSSEESTVLCWRDIERKTSLTAEKPLAETASAVDSFMLVPDGKFRNCKRLVMNYFTEGFMS